MQFLKLGNIFAIVYIFVMSFSIVWISHLQDFFNESFMLLLVSFVAIIFYNIGKINSLKNAYFSIKRNPFDWFLMSFTFAMTWWLVYFSTIHASPSVAMVSFYLVMASCGCLSDRKFFYAFICVTAIAISYVMMPSASNIGKLLSIFGGIFGYIYLKLSGLFAEKNNLSAKQILSIRFYILFVSAAFFLEFMHPEKFHYSFGGNFLWYFFSLTLLVIFNLLPNYCAQKGIELLGVNKFSKIVAFTPALTFFLQNITNNHLSISVLVLCLTVSFLLNFVAIEGKPKKILQSPKIF